MSAAYDLPSTCAALQSTVFGIYDNYIVSGLKKSFGQRKYKVQQKYEPHLCEITINSQAAANLLAFDDKVRSKIFGMPGVHTLYRAISHNLFIPEIQTPTFALVAKDDPVTLFKFVPVEDLQRNPNIVLAVAELGGHCDFLENSTEPDAERKYDFLVPKAALEYFEKVAEFNSTNRK